MKPTELRRRLMVVMDVRARRAEHALKAAGLPTPPKLNVDDIVRLHDAELLCPGCGAELPMPISADPGWFCVQCGRGWSKRWRAEADGGRA